MLKVSAKTVLQLIAAYLSASQEGDLGLGIFSPGLSWGGRALPSERGDLSCLLDDPFSSSIALSTFILS